MIGGFGALWGAAGVLALLLSAIYRLGLRAVEAWHLGLTGWQWVLTAAVCTGMAYSEGYLGFQRGFSPRTAARIRYLRDNPRPVHVLLAPLFAMGFFHAPLRTRIRVTGVLVAVVVLVLLVHRLDQPWRGIVDAGVVVGLGWGVVSLAFSILQALTQPEFGVSPEVPSPRRAAIAGSEAEAEPGAQDPRLGVR